MRRVGPRARGPESYVHGGPDAPVVVVPARVAAWLARAARLQELRTAVRGVDAELDDVLVALAVAAASWVQGTGSGSERGTGGDSGAEPAPRSRLTTTEAADLLGITDRGVRKAIAAGRLPAQREGETWVISRQDLEHFRVTRAA